jgi:hypothetical protein
VRPPSATSGAEAFTSAGKFTPGWRWQDASTDQARFFLGDANGDGWADVFMIEKDPANETSGPGYEHARIRVAVAKPGGITFETTTRDTADRWQNEDHWFAGDVNGDGYTDVMHVIKMPATASRAWDYGRLQHWLSDGSGQNFSAAGAIDTPWRWYFDCNTTILRLLGSDGPDAIDGCRSGWRAICTGRGRHQRRWQD